MYQILVVANGQLPDLKGTCVKLEPMMKGDRICNYYVIVPTNNRGRGAGTFNCVSHIYSLYLSWLRPTILYVGRL